MKDNIIEDNNKENCLKMPTNWTFDSSQEREITIKTNMLCSLLNRLGPCSKMGHWLKFNFRSPSDYKDNHWFSHLYNLTTLTN